MICAACLPIPPVAPVMTTVVIEILLAGGKTRPISGEVGRSRLRDPWREGYPLMSSGKPPHPK
jgi:hypothetical protein